MRRDVPMPARDDRQFVLARDTCLGGDGKPAKMKDDNLDIAQIYGEINFASVVT